MMENSQAETSWTQQIMITNLESVTIDELFKIISFSVIEDESHKKNFHSKCCILLRNLYLAVRSKDLEIAKYPMKRFLMSNDHNIWRVERILFRHVA